MLASSQRFFAMLPQSQKINRIAAVRSVLTTKDGLCNMQKQSGLAAAQLDGFSFPCWHLEHDSARLQAQLRAPHNKWDRWIVKPMRGSQAWHGMAWHGMAWHGIA